MVNVPIINKLKTTIEKFALLKLQLIILLIFFSFLLFAQEKNKTSVYISIGRVQSVFTDDIINQGFYEWNIGSFHPKYNFQLTAGTGNNNYRFTFSSEFTKSLYGRVETGYIIYKSLFINLYYDYGGRYSEIEMGDSYYISDVYAKSTFGLSPRFIFSRNHFLFSTSIQLPVSGTKMGERKIYKNGNISHEIIKSSGSEIGYNAVNFIVSVGYFF